MTKPTGRPRGRPKTREYTTLMARVDIVLANQVKRYASLHRQPISLVIRDALSLLMEEYPAETDRTGSHRLAAHEFLSDRYETPLDTLVGETGNAELEEFVSDKNKAAIAILDADEHSAREYCEFHDLMRLRERSIKHLQPFFTLKNATGDIICCDLVDFYTN